MTGEVNGVEGGTRRGPFPDGPPPPRAAALLCSPGSVNGAGSKGRCALAPLLLPPPPTDEDDDASCGLGASHVLVYTLPSAGPAFQGVLLSHDTPYALLSFALAPGRNDSSYRDGEVLKPF